VGGDLSVMPLNIQLHGLDRLGVASGPVLCCCRRLRPIRHALYR